MNTLLQFFIFVSCLFFFSTPSSFAEESIYIKLGDPSTKKVDLVIKTKLSKSFETSPHAAGFQTEFLSVLQNDLQVSAMFKIVKGTESLDTPEMTLEVSPEINGSNLTLEVKALKKNTLAPLFSESFKGPTSQLRRLAHTLANRFLENLTGVTGPFLTRFVVATDRAGGSAREIFYMDWDGSNPVRVSHHGNIARSPNWSADGGKITYTAFVRVTKNAFESAQIILHDLASKSSRLVTRRAGNNSGANFTPDGSHLYITSSSEGNNDIYKVSPDNGETLSRLTKGPLGAMNVEPAVSPDGSQIVFSSDRGGNTALYIMKADGTEVKRLTHFKEFANTPAWSPDGKKIVFAGQDSGNFDIFMIDADGQNLKRITQGARKPNGKLARNEYPSFSSDGRFILYTSDRTGKNQIFISNIHGTSEFQITHDEFNYYSPKWSWTNY